jgi:RecB family endonuclease NucS
MRLFAVTEAGDFLEYQEEIFREEYREETVESWLASNPDCISEEDSLLIIGRQVSTDLRTAIDLLAVDSEGNAAVIELKRDRTPRETLAQALEYASFIEQLSYEQLCKPY